MGRRDLSRGLPAEIFGAFQGEGRVAVLGPADYTIVAMAEKVKPPVIIKK